MTVFADVSAPRFDDLQPFGLRLFNGVEEEEEARGV